MSDRLTVVTGAGGQTGRAVVLALVAAGLPVRAVVRREEHRAALAAAGAAPVVADLTDRSAVRAALVGAGAVYHIAPNMSEHEELVAAHVLAAAPPRVVFHSVLRPGISAMPHHLAKLRVEEALWASGADVTVLQPGMYAQNLVGQLPRVRAEGRLVVPYRTDAPVTMVDVAEVAEVAARVLAEDTHVGAAYELCGPLTTVDGVAAGLAELLGRPVAAERVPPGDWPTASLPDGYARDGFAAMWQYYDDHGLAGNPTVLRHLLGRPPADPVTVLAERLG